jgi:outer membrane cobalamin receptor
MFFLAAARSATASSNMPETMLADTSAARDSLHSAKDSLAHHDSLIVVYPNLAEAFTIGAETTSVTTAQEFHWLDPRFPGDVVASWPGVYHRDPNSQGQYEQINFRGADWRGVAVTMDGRIMNDPASGIYNLDHVAPDYLDRVEVVSGPRSFLYGLNGAGGTINLVTKQYDSNRPFSALRYSESGYQYTDVDGMYSQNIIEGLNLTLGFRHEATNGRYPNSEHSLWNGIVKIRHRFSESFSVILSEYLTSTNTQMNGGIHPDFTGLSGAFFPLETSVRNADSYEKLHRNDVNLSFVGNFFGNDSNLTNLTFYYSNNFRQYRDETGGFIPNSLFIQSDHTSSWTGALLTQEIRTGFQRFSFGANVEQRQIEGSPNLGRRQDVIGNVRATEELFLGEYLTVAAFGRYDRYFDTDYFAVGADGSIRLGDIFRLFGGISRSHRVPGYEELYWSDSTVTRVTPLTDEEHTHVEIGSEISLPWNGCLRVALFQRTITDPLLLEPYGSGFVFPGIQFANREKITNNGADFHIRFRPAHLLIEASGTYLIQDQGGTSPDEFPAFSGTGGVYFWDRILDDHLGLKAGARGRYQTSQVGTEFNPEVLAYVRNAHQEISGGGTVDLVIIANIGDAYVHFLWENLLNTEYYATPFYPALDRAIQFGISWTFLD